MREFLHSLPKSELHLHLRGSMPSSLFGELREKYPPETALAAAPDRHRELFARMDNIRPFLSTETSRATSAERLYSYRSFEQFLVTYLFTSYFFREVADFERLVEAVRRGLTSQHIVYAEITVSLIEYVQQGLPLPELLDVLEAASRLDHPRVRWIVDLVRDFGPETCLSLLKQVVERRPSGVVGVTLGGSEHRFPAADYEASYRLARDAGLRRTVHAGEGAGPESVWAALETLQAERIGHGVRASEDQRLMAHLAEKQVPLEVCPTSNLQTGLYSSYEEHPVRRLHEAGIPVTISTDDPAFFRVTLTDGGWASPSRKFERSFGTASSTLFSPKKTREPISTG
jgi:adenosine deaminase